MISVPVYIAMRFATRVYGFFEHWYVGGTRAFWNKLVEIISSLDGTFAVILTVRHLFEPLYQDNTILGYILGFIFRTLRAFIGIVLYVFITVFIFALYSLWLALPLYTAFKVLESSVL